MPFTKPKPEPKPTDVVTHYQQQGEGKPVVVLSHSLGTDLRIWDDVSAELRSAHRVVSYDLRGHGLTDSTPPPYSIDTLARDLLGLLDELQIDDAVLVGISIGGQIVLRSAALEPRRVRALVLCDTATKIGDESMWNARLASIEAGGLDAAADSILARWFAPSFPEANPGAYRGYRNLLLRTSPRGYVGAAAALRDADLESDARTVHAPTLVLCGAEDSATPPRQARSLAESIEGARLELVTAAGHLSCVEQPHAVARLIRDFLA